LLTTKKTNHMTHKLLILCITGFALIHFSGCDQPGMPKPKGYPRIGLPEKSYRLSDTTFPYQFEYPAYSYIEPAAGPAENPFWINVVFPDFKGKIYLSYKPLKGNIRTFTEDTRNFVMKHIPKATSIDELSIYDPKSRVYGIIYEIKGIQAASPCQFYFTDSIQHFLRGALYFEVIPNNDSLEPVIRFLMDDIQHFAGTLEWNKL